VQRSLRHGGQLADRRLQRLPAAAEFLDSTLDRFGVRFRLFEVLLQPFPVRPFAGDRDMGLQGSLQFALLALGLAEVLHQLCITLVQIRHRDSRLLLIVRSVHLPHSPLRRNGAAGG